MQLIFVCPETGKSFHSENFRIAEDKGVQSDNQGRKFLDAKVALTEACPFCGQMHLYRTDDLVCPFGT